MKKKSLKGLLRLKKVLEKEAKEQRASLEVTEGLLASVNRELDEQPLK